MKKKPNTFHAEQCKSFLNSIAINIYLFIICTNIVFAGNMTADTASMDSVIAFMLTWVTRIGIVVAIFGGIEFGFAYSNDNADAKNRALRHLASGFIIAGIAQSPSIFGF